MLLARLRPTISCTALLCCRSVLSPVRDHVTSPSMAGTVENHGQLFVRMIVDTSWCLLFFVLFEYLLQGFGWRRPLVETERH
jgi:hypothetical protein